MSSGRRNVVLLSCVKSKLKVPAPARLLYASTWFRLALAYAHSLRPDLILILSAKHGVLGLEETVAPYDDTLNDATVATRRQWALRVLSQLSQVVDLDNDEFTILAGKRYREFLVPLLKHFQVPMDGLRQGEQLGFLRRHMDEVDRPSVTRS